MNKKERKALEREYWKSLHDENGNLVSVSDGGTQTIEEYVRMNLPPEMANGLLNEYNEACKNFSKMEVDESVRKNEIDTDRLKYINYEEI